MPLFRLPPLKFAAYNEYRLGGGGNARALSPHTGKPFFNAAETAPSRMAFSFYEKSRPSLTDSRPGVLDVLGFDTPPRFSNLREFENAIGRSLNDGEWVKVCYTRLHLDEASLDWQFDARYPEYSAKFEITAPMRALDAVSDASRVQAPLISFINDLAASNVEKPTVTSEWARQIYFLRRVQVNANPIARTDAYFAMANLPSVAALERTQSMRVDLTATELLNRRHFVVRQGAELKLSQGTKVDGPKFFSTEPERADALYRARLEWLADGVAQKPIELSVVPSHGIATYLAQSALIAVPPGTKQASFSMISESAMGHPKSPPSPIRREERFTISFVP